MRDPVDQPLFGGGVGARDFVQRNSDRLTQGEVVPPPAGDEAIEQGLKRSDVHVPACTPLVIAWIAKDGNIVRAISPWRIATALA